MSRTIVGVLRGGNSSEYDASLKTGAMMLRALPEERYEARDILVDKQGRWHLRGAPVEPLRALSQIDVALNAIHGGMGEDGTLARMLDRASIPYAGTAAFPSAIAFNKISTRNVLKSAGISIPQGISFTLDDDMDTADMARAVFARFGPPYVVKPPREGASHGIIIAPTIVELSDAIGDVLDAHGSALVEEFIRGQEASVGVIQSFREQDLYVLPPARVVLPDGARHIEHSMYDSDVLRYVTPSDFSSAQKQSLESIARQAHQALDLGHFSRADVIVTPRRAYLLEVNTTPALHQGASFPPMLESVGSSVGEFLEHAISLARGGIRSI